MLNITDLEEYFMLDFLYAAIVVIGALLAVGGLVAVILWIATEFYGD